MQRGGQQTVSSWCYKTKSIHSGILKVSATTSSLLGKEIRTNLWEVHDSSPLFWKRVSYCSFTGMSDASHGNAKRHLMYGKITSFLGIFIDTINFCTYLFNELLSINSFFQSCCKHNNMADTELSAVLGCYHHILNCRAVYVQPLHRHRLCSSGP